MHPEFLTLTTADQLDLPALLFEPEEKTKKVVIFLHGCGSASIFYKQKKMSLFAQELDKVGYSFFPFNNRGAHYLKKFSRGVGEEKVEVMKGTSTEIIAETVLDINAAVDFLKSRGYEHILLMGESTGANKICVYQHFQPKNSLTGYILVGGGDDTGLWWNMLGDQAQTLFTEAQKRVKIDQQTPQAESDKTSLDLISTKLSNAIMSYQGLYNVMNPDGDYNTFPFREFTTDWKISHQPLFRYYQEIDKPTFALYGELDEYTGCDPHQAVEILSQVHRQPSLISTQVVSGCDHGFKDNEILEISAVIAWLKNVFS